MKFQSFYFKLYKRFSKVIFKTLYLTPRGFCIPSVHTVFWLCTQGIKAPRLGLGRLIGPVENKGIIYDNEKQLSAKIWCGTTSKVNFRFY